MGTREDLDARLSEFDQRRADAEAVFAQLRPAEPLLSGAIASAAASAETTVN